MFFLIENDFQKKSRKKNFFRFSNFQKKSTFSKNQKSKKNLDFLENVDFFLEIRKSGKQIYFFFDFFLKIIFDQKKIFFFDVIFFKVHLQVKENRVVAVAEQFRLFKGAQNRERAPEANVCTFFNTMSHIKSQFSECTLKSNPCFSQTCRAIEAFFFAKSNVWLKHETTVPHVLQHSALSILTLQTSGNWNWALRDAWFPKETETWLECKIVYRVFKKSERKKCRCIRGVWSSYSQVLKHWRVQIQYERQNSFTSTVALGPEINSSSVHINLYRRLDFELSFI